MRTLLLFTLLLAGCSGASSDEEASEAADTAAVDASATPAPAPSEAPDTMAKTMVCGEGGETLFACRVASGKRITVCANPDGGAQYRFGKDQPELTLEGGSFAQAAYSGGGEAQIAFTGKGTRYVVFSRVVRTNFAADETNNPAMSDGVVVLDGERVIGMQLCSGADTQPVDSTLAEARLSRADELFTYETERADAQPAAD